MIYRQRLNVHKHIVISLTEKNKATVLNEPMTKVQKAYKQHFKELKKLHPEIYFRYKELLEDLDSPIKI